MWRGNGGSTSRSGSPPLFVATSFVYLALAVPAGRLVDRIGRARVFLGGYALLPAVYLMLLWSGANWLVLGGALLLFGAYYAATDGVLMGWRVRRCRRSSRTTEIACWRRLLAWRAARALGTRWTVQAAELDRASDHRDVEARRLTTVVRLQLQVRS
jgi:MFS family permease